MSGLSPEQLQDLANLARQGEDTRAGATFCLLESAADACFLTLEGGTKIFYPQGAFGRRGYIVESSRSEEALRRRVKNLHVGTILAVPLLASAYGAFLRDTGLLRFALLIACSFVAWWLIARLGSWPLTRRLKRSDVSNSPIACWNRMGQRTHPVWLILAPFYFAALSAVGFVFFATERNPVGLAIGLMMPLAAVPYLVAIRHRWQDRRSLAAGRRRRITREDLTADRR